MMYRKNGRNADGRVGADREACVKSLVDSSSTRDLLSGLGVASRVHRTREKLGVGEMEIAK